MSRKRWLTGFIATLTMLALAACGGDCNDFAHLVKSALVALAIFTVGMVSMVIINRLPEQ